MSIVLLGGIRWLKPDTTLAEMGSRAEAVECLGLKPCWEERVPSDPTIDRRRSRSNIFTAWQSSEMGVRSDSGLVTPLPSKSGLWQNSSKFPWCQLWQLRVWRAPSGRPGRIHQDGGGGAKWAHQTPLRWKRPPSLRPASTLLSSDGLHERFTRWWSLMNLMSARSYWAEQAANCFLNACAIAFELEWGFPSKAIEMLPPSLRGIDGSVEGLQERPQLILHFLANEPLDVPVKQLDGRVEEVIGAGLIYLSDEGSHNIGERAALIPNITAGDVVSSGVAEVTPEDFFSSKARGCQRCFRKSPLWLCCESLPVSPVEFRVGMSFPRWGGVWRERETVMGRR